MFYKSVANRRKSYLRALSYIPVLTSKHCLRKESENDLRLDRFPIVAKLSLHGLPHCLKGGGFPESSAIVYVYS